MLEPWLISFRGYISQIENREVDILEDLYAHPSAALYKGAFEAGVAYTVLTSEYVTEVTSSSNINLPGALDLWNAGQDISDGDMPSLIELAPQASILRISRKVSAVQTDECPIYDEWDNMYKESDAQLRARILKGKQ